MELIDSETIDDQRAALSYYHCYRAHTSLAGEVMFSVVSVGLCVHEEGPSPRPLTTLGQPCPNLVPPYTCSNWEITPEDVCKLALGLRLKGLLVF